MIKEWWGNLLESCDVRLLVGTGFYLSWVLLLAVSPVFSNVPTLIIQGVSWRLLAIAAAAIALAFAFMLPSKTDERPKRCASIAIASGIAATAGPIIHQFFKGQPTEIISAALAGCGLVGLCLLWSKPFVLIKLRKRVVGTAAGSILGCILYLCVAIAPHPFSFVLGSCLPLASAFCWMLLNACAESCDNNLDLPSRATKKAETACSSANPELPNPSKTSLFGRPLSSAVVLYAMLFVLAGHALPEQEPSWTRTALPGIESVVAFLILEIILSIYMVKRVHRENPIVAYRPATILVAATFLALPFVNEDVFLACVAIAFAGFGSFMVYFWIVMGNICQKRSMPSVTVFSRGLFMTIGGLMLGEATVSLIHFYQKAGFAYIATLSIVALFLLVIMTWQMSDGSLMANETEEMGGEFFEHASETAPPKPNLSFAIDKYSLSPRESEVLELLLKGRSIPYICDELFVAKSTVQTHVRHIYAKMEITGGRQELIDRIENEG